MTGLSITELTKRDPALPRLDYHYVTARYYDLISTRSDTGWRIELKLKSFDPPAERAFTGRLFRPQVEEPRVFAAIRDDEQVGWIEVGHEKWHNRSRVWEFLVKEGFRRRGIGSLLMERAVEAAKERGARMLALETQTCNVPAISFYLKHGFMLIGFDTAAYHNDDVDRKEVRLEMGLTLRPSHGGRRIR